MHGKVVAKAAERAWLYLALLFAIAPFSAPPAYAQPSDPALKELCETEEGRRQILANRPPYEIRDLEAQEKGLAMNEQREPNVEAYKLKWVEEYCGIALIDGPKYTFTYDFSQLPVPDPERPGVMLGNLPPWECNVDYNEKCEPEAAVLRIPWYWILQACRFEYRVSKRGKDVGVEVLPRFPIEDVEGLSRRFEGYSVRIWARGPGTILNKVGAKMRIEGVRIAMIDARATNEDRRKLNCDFYPAAVTAPKPPPKPPTKPDPRPSLPKFEEAFADGKHSYRFALTSTSSVRAVVDYAVYMTNGNGERQWATGRQVVEPGTTWLSDGYHNWDARNWRTRIALAPGQ
jgi:hypothetical protein